MKKVSTMKKKAWKVFSEWIRRKDADSNGMNFCVTCGKMEHWKFLQAGHFIDGRGNSILFDERGVHPQDVACNLFKHGNKVEYFIFMKKYFGERVINELRIASKQVKQMSYFDYEQIYLLYKRKLGGLL